LKCEVHLKQEEKIGKLTWWSKYFVLFGAERNTLWLDNSERVNECFVLVGLYAAQNGTVLPTFRDYVSVPYSRVKQSSWIAWPSMNIILPWGWRQEIPPNVNKLTLWIRFFFEKLTSPKLIKKFTVCYGKQMFITAFTTARHLSWARSIYSMSSHPISWRSILILKLHVHLGLSSRHFPSLFPTKLCMHLSFSHTCYISRPTNSSLFDRQSRNQTAAIFSSTAILSSIWLSCLLFTVNKKRLSDLHRIYIFEMFLALYEY